MDPCWGPCPAWHIAHIALSETMTNRIKQGSSLGLCPTFPSPNPHFKPTFGSLTLRQVLSVGRQRQIQPRLTTTAEPETPSNSKPYLTK